jgi:ArsR family transcriptional regulator
VDLLLWKRKYFEKPVGLIVWRADWDGRQNRGSGKTCLSINSTIENMSAADIQLDNEQFTLITKALAEPKRFEMLQRIGQSKQAPTCSCLCDWVQLAPATVSHHIKELEAAGLVNVERAGKFAHVKLRRDIWKAYLKRLSAL